MNSRIKKVVVSYMIDGVSKKTTLKVYDSTDGIITDDARSRIFKHVLMLESVNNMKMNLFDISCPALNILFMSAVVEDTKHTDMCSSADLLGVI